MIQHRDVWTAAELLADLSWIIPLSEVHKAELLAAKANLARDHEMATSPEHFPLPLLGSLLDTLIDQLEDGVGVALLRGVPIDDFPIKDVEMLFRGIATHIGYAEPQDALGNTLHHVRAERHYDNNADLIQSRAQDHNWRGYQTNEELCFHGDGSDALLFLCCRPAKNGGVTHILSAGAAFNAVQAQDPKLAAILLEEFPFDALGALGPDRPWQSVPIFIPHDGRMCSLYKRGYIDSAVQQKGAPPLTSRQVAALDTLDSVLADPALQVSFVMQPGDLLIANNHSIWHSRSAFIDDERLNHKRLMLRIWITLRRKRRSLPPVLKTTREFAATQRRREQLGD